MRSVTIGQSRPSIAQRRLIRYPKGHGFRRGILSDLLVRGEWLRRLLYFRHGYRDKRLPAPQPQGLSWMPATTNIGPIARANVQAAANAGVNLAFLSGNEIYLADTLRAEHRWQRHGRPHDGHL